MKYSTLTPFLWKRRVRTLSFICAKESNVASIFLLNRGEQVMNFSTDNLRSLLCTARSYMMKARGEDTGKLYGGYKVGRSGDRKAIEISANAGDIVEYIDGNTCL